MTFLELSAGFLALTWAVIGQGFVSAQSTILAMYDIDSSSARFVDYTKRDEVAQYVKEYFADTPVLAEVARCESTFRQVGLNGNVLRGTVNDRDVGVMQINERYHTDTAESLGYDLYTLEGNLAYAKYLHDKEGLKPWRSSKKCWAQSEEYKKLTS